MCRLIKLKLIDALLSKLYKYKAIILELKRIKITKN